MPIPLDEFEYNSNKLLFDSYLNDKEFINYIQKNESFFENETYYFAIDCFDRFWKKQSKLKHKKSKYVFITIQDFQRRLTDIDLLEQFISKIDYLYHSGSWVIEAGKTGKNVHLHLLVKIINSDKHKNKLNIEWRKLFDTNLKDKDYYKLSQHRDVKGMPKYSQWLEEKLDYFDNSKKNDHANSIDLNLQGDFSGGGVTV